MNVSTALANPKIACEVGFVIGFITSFVITAIIDHIHWKRIDKDLKEMISDNNKILAQLKNIETLDVKNI